MLKIQVIYIQKIHKEWLWENKITPPQGKEKCNGKEQTFHRTNANDQLVQEKVPDLLIKEI